MQITRVESRGGVTYRIYRLSEQFPARVMPLIPFFLKARQCVWLADSPSEPHLVITIESLSGAQESELVGMVGGYLEDEGGGAG